MLHLLLVFNVQPQGRGSTKNLIWPYPLTTLHLLISYWRSRPKAATISRISCDFIPWRLCITYSYNIQPEGSGSYKKISSEPIPWRLCISLVISSPKAGSYKKISSEHIPWQLCISYWCNFQPPRQRLWQNISSEPIPWRLCISYWCNIQP